MAHKRIPELETIEFTGSESVARYAKEGRDLFRDLAWELQESMAELEAALAGQKGNPLLLGLDVKVRARRVTNRGRRAAEAAAGGAAEMVKLNAQYRKDFVSVAQEVERRKKDRRKWNFE